MIETKELIRWAQTLPEDSSVRIDAGGLSLVCDLDSAAYLEVGGEPDEEDDCTACSDRSCLWCKEEDRVRAIPNKK